MVGSDTPHGVLWVPASGALDACMNTVGTHMGFSEHWHGDPNWVLSVLTSGTECTHIGTVGTHTGYCAFSHGPCKNSHMEQSCDLAVGVKCGMLKTAVLCL